MRRPALLAAVALSLSLTGCVSKPTMKLNHADIAGIQVGFPLQINVVMRVVMEVYNPNSYDVAVRAVRGQTVLAEKYALPVDVNFGPQGFWLPSKRTTALTVSFSVPAQLGIAVLGEAFVGASVPYRFQGKADVTATSTFALEKDDYSIDERGEIPRAQFEAAIRSAIPHWLVAREEEVAGRQGRQEERPVPGAPGALAADSVARPHGRATASSRAGAWLGRRAWLRGAALPVQGGVRAIAQLVRRFSVGSARLRRQRTKRAISRRPATCEGLLRTPVSRRTFPCSRTFASPPSSSPR